MGLEHDGALAEALEVRSKGHGFVVGREQELVDRAGGVEEDETGLIELAAKGSPLVLVIGLGIAIVLMAIASHMIARLLARYPWITWVGLLIILYVSLDMIYSGSAEVFCRMYNFGCGQSFARAIVDWSRR